MRLLLIFVLYCVYSLSATAQECGFSWNKFYGIAFKNINIYGNVDISETFDSRKIDGENYMEISANFNSARKTASKTLGYGWWFGLTDSYIVKNAYNSYKAIMPNESEIILKQSGKNKKIYASHGKRWALEEIPNGFMLASSCGNVLIYKKGNLEQIKYANGTTLFFKYEGGALKQINLKGVPIVSFKYENNLVYLHLENGKRTIKFTRADTPDCGKILAKIEYMPDYPVSKEYRYKISDTENSELCILHENETKKYCWDTRGFIVAEETCINNKQVEKFDYTITNKNDPDIYKYIKRKSQITQLCDISYRNGNGVSVMQTNGGNIVKTSENMNIACLGKPLKIETVYPDGGREEQLFMYDDKGRLIREVKNGKVLYNIKRNDAKRSITYYGGNWNFVWEKVYDAKDRVVCYKKADGTTTTFEYLKDDKIKATLTKNGQSITKHFSSDTTIVKCLDDEGN